MKNSTHNCLTMSENNRPVLRYEQMCIFQISKSSQMKLDSNSKHMHIDHCDCSSFLSVQNVNDDWLAITILPPSKTTKPIS